mgnify:CR=1 FL=1
MTKTELAAAVSAQTDIPLTAVSKTLNATLETITQELAHGGSVTLPGFGTFSLKHREARKGHNPATGEEIMIPAGDTPSFKAGKTLKDAVNG